LSRHIAQAPAGGLTELLVGQTSFDAIASEMTQPGLHFIAGGARPPNPFEILTSSRFERALEVFSQQFDLVIVDTPPLLAAPDAAVIASMAGSTLLTLRAGASNERTIADAIKKLQHARAYIVGAVLNAMPPRNGNVKGTYDYAFSQVYASDIPNAPDLDNRG
jgi:tyrosine-protein kinase Etk/Wzc